MFAQVSNNGPINDQAEARQPVSAFFIVACAALFAIICITPPDAVAQAETLDESVVDSIPPVRVGMIGARDILVKIVSDTVFLADTVAETTLVTIDAQGTDISGFDFTFAYDMSSVEIYDAAPGDFLESCGWEYFIVRRNPRCEGPCPHGLIKVIALAEFQERERTRRCNTPAPGASLVKLLIRPTGSTPKQSAGSVRFFWIDCGDNSISSVSGNDLFVGRSVADADSVSPPLANETEFPTYGGPIPDCFNKHPVNPPRRKIRFSNGTLTLMIENPAPDSLR